MSAWFAGEATLLPFPYLRVGVLLAFGVSGVCGLRRRSRLPFVVRLPFPVSVGPSSFLGLGVAWSQVCGPSCDSWVLDSSDTRLRHPGTLASGRTLSFCRRVSLPWAFAWAWVSRPRLCLGSSLLLLVLPSIVLGFDWRLCPLGGPGTCSFLGPSLGFFPLASSVGCWLEVVEVYP